MSDPEAIYYYIRNAFAHGLFEVRSTQHGNVYLLESAKKRNVNARMRLNETAMMELVRIMDLTSGDLIAFPAPTVELRIIWLFSGSSCEATSIVSSLARVCDLERVGGGRIHPATSS